MAGKVGALPSAFTSTPQFAVRYHRKVTLSTGREVMFAPVAGGVAVMVSDNGGDTWQACTSPTDGIINTNASSVIAADVDSRDGIHILVGSISSTALLSLDYHLVTVSGLTATSVKTQVEAGAASGFAWKNLDIKVHSMTGTTANIFLVYDLVNVSSGSNNNTLYARSATVAGDGTITLGTRYTIASVAEGSVRHLFAISKRYDGTCKLLYQQAANGSASAKAAVVTMNFPMNTAPSQSTLASGYYYATQVSSIDGLDSCLWVVDGDGVRLWSDSGKGDAITAGSEGTYVGDRSNNRILALSADATTKFLKLTSVNATTHALISESVIGKKAIGTMGYGLSKYSGRVSAMYVVTGDGIWSETINLGLSSGYHMII